MQKYTCSSIYPLFLFTSFTLLSNLILNHPFLIARIVIRIVKPSVIVIKSHDCEFTTITGEKVIRINSTEPITINAKPKSLSVLLFKSGSTILSNAIPIATAPVVQPQVKLLRNLSAAFSNFLQDTECEVYFALFDVQLFAENKHDADIDNVVQPDLSVVCDKGNLDDKGL